MKTTLKILTAVIVLALPAFIIMTSIRLLLTPLTLQAEYRLLNVPADPYGFSTEERLHWSNVSLDYLLNREGISSLADQKLEDGSPLFIDRELSHMQDVKNLIHIMLIAWVIIGVILVGFRFLYRAFKRSDMYWSAISIGGWVTMGLVGVIVLGVLLNFDAFFTDFHLIFFTGETWLFYYSDNLIRLFPLEFWANIFIALGVLMLLFGLLFALLGRAYRKKAKNLEK